MPLVYTYLLIVVNCIILGRAEAYASKNSVVPSIFDGLGMGLGFTVGLTLIGICREVLGSGAVFGFQFIPEDFHITFFVLAPGAFLVLACLTAVQNKLKLPSATNVPGGDSSMACGGNCAQCTGASCVANKGIIEAERVAQKQQKHRQQKKQQQKLKRQKKRNRQRRGNDLSEYFVIMISSMLVSNVVLSQFLGICPFLGVSKKVETAAGMGAAVTFVITIASAITYPIYYFILEPLGLEYLETIAFILIIAALVQFVEWYLRSLCHHYMKHLVCSFHLLLQTVQCLVWQLIILLMV